MNHDSYCCRYMYYSVICVSVQKYTNYRNWFTEEIQLKSQLIENQTQGLVRDKILCPIQHDVYHGRPVN